MVVYCSFGINSDCIFKLNYFAFEILTIGFPVILYNFPENNLSMAVSAFRGSLVFNVRLVFNIVSLMSLSCISISCAKEIVETKRKKYKLIRRIAK